jgi:anti-anti-sigma factor
MHATVRPSAGNCLVTIAGRITIDSSPDLRTLFFQWLGSRSCESLTADFSEVIYVDASAVAVLLETLGGARRLKKAFRVTGLREQPRYLLENTRLLPLFDHVANEQPN